MPNNSLAAPGLILNKAHLRREVTTYISFGFVLSSLIAIDRVFLVDDFSPNLKKLPHYRVDRFLFILQYTIRYAGFTSI